MTNSLLKFVRRNNASTILPGQRKCKCASSVNGQHGEPGWTQQDTMHTCLKERWERGFIQNNQDPHKEEIKIPPPHPHERKNISYFSTQRIHIFSALQNDNVVNVFILNKENMTDLHVYTYIHTYTKIIHTHTQISNRKKQHKCRHDEPWICRQTDESLVKASQTIKMNHGDVDRRTTRWWRRRRRCDEEPCEDIRRFLKCVLHKTRNIVTGDTM